MPHRLWKRWLSRNPLNSDSQLQNVRVSLISFNLAKRSQDVFSHILTIARKQGGQCLPIICSQEVPRLNATEINLNDSLGYCRIWKGGCDDCSVVAPVELAHLFRGLLFGRYHTAVQIGKYIFASMYLGRFDGEASSVDLTFSAITTCVQNAIRSQGAEEVFMGIDANTSLATNIGGINNFGVMDNRQGITWKIMGAGTLGIRPSQSELHRTKFMEFLNVLGLRLLNTFGSTNNVEVLYTWRARHGNMADRTKPQIDFVASTALVKHNSRKAWVVDRHDVTAPSAQCRKGVGFSDHRVVVAVLEGIDFLLESAFSEDELTRQQKQKQKLSTSACKHDVKGWEAIDFESLCSFRNSTEIDLLKATDISCAEKLISDTALRTPHTTVSSRRMLALHTDIDMDEIRQAKAKLRNLNPTTAGWKEALKHPSKFCGSKNANETTGSYYGCNKHRDLCDVLGHKWTTYRQARALVARREQAGKREVFLQSRIQ